MVKPKTQSNWVVFLGGLLPYVCCVPAWAAEPVVTRPAAAMLQTLLGLALVLALIFGLACLSRRLGGALPGNNKIMKILAVMPVGTREKIVLVEVGGQQMMLGVTPGQINMLQVFNESVVNTGSGDTSKNTNKSTGLGTVAPMKNLAARSASEFSKKLNEFLNQGNRS